MSQVVIRSPLLVRCPKCYDIGYSGAIIPDLGQAWLHGVPGIPNSCYNLGKNIRQGGKYGYCSL